MRSWVSMLVGFTLIGAAMTPASAEPLALASCAKFTAAKDEKGALFAGYIYGFLAARLGTQDEKRLTATALKVRSSALDFCRKNQNAAFVKVVGALAADAAKKSWIPKL
jgi:hypothetical protein